MPPTVGNGRPSHWQRIPTRAPSEGVEDMPQVVSYIPTPAYHSLPRPPRAPPTAFRRSLPTHSPTVARRGARLPYRPLSLPPLPPPFPPSTFSLAPAITMVTRQPCRWRSSRRWRSPPPLRRRPRRRCPSRRRPPRRRRCQPWPPSRTWSPAATRSLAATWRARSAAAAAGRPSGWSAEAPPPPRPVATLPPPPCA